MFTLAVISSLLVLGSAQASWDAYWTRGTRAAASQSHKVTIAVTLNKDTAEACPSMLMDISTPGRPNYMKHLPFDAMKMFTNMTNYKMVRTWLTNSGVADDRVEVTPNFEFITLYSTVSELERLFDAQFFEYTSTEKSDLKIRRASSVIIPRHLKHSIDFVSNTEVFPPPPSTITPQLNKNTNADAAGNVSPSLLQRYYNIDVNQKDPRSTQSLFESLGQTFTPKDLAQFQQTYNLPSLAVAKTIGTNNPSTCEFNPNDCTEANLDVQWILAVAQNTTTWYWSIPSGQDIFSDWIVAVAGNSDAPYVHSISYGSVATEDPKLSMERFNSEACKLGLRGLSIMVATGDDGVANFVARSDPSKCGFNPSFPATSPYVTAVGATQGPEAGEPEIACTSATGGLITSGGGFSDTFKRPDYQDAAVNGYLTNGPNLPPFKSFNRNGRAYPDVSAMGHNYPIVINGQTTVGSGTSASTPVFAGMISLINGQRFAQGKGPVGFLNPTLYSNAGAAFNDITSGENNCCAGQPGTQTCCPNGFNATTGWDPITGWGSPKWQELSTLLTSA